MRWHRYKRERTVAVKKTIKAIIKAKRGIKHSENERERGERQEEKKKREKRERREREREREAAHPIAVPTTFRVTNP